MNKGAQYRELGAVLRARREQAGLTGRELSRLTGWTKTKISRIETGQSMIDAVDAIHYLGHCGLFRRDVMDELALLKDAERRLGFWLSPHGEWLEDSLGSLIYHEVTAAESTTYEPLLVPGLLQTSDYARTRIAAEQWRSPENVKQCVRIRMERQRILDLPYPAMFRFFVHEQALLLEVGSPVVMHEQMLKLALATALDHISLRVVPLSAGERSAFGGPFIIFEYAHYPPLVCLDTGSSGLFLEDKEHTAPFRTLLPVISEVALNEGQSRELVATLASEYDRRSEQHAGDHLEEEQL